MKNINIYTDNFNIKDAQHMASAVIEAVGRGDYQEINIFMNSIDVHKAHKTALNALLRYTRCCRDKIADYDTFLLKTLDEYKSRGVSTYRLSTLIREV